MNNVTAVSSAFSINSTHHIPTGRLLISDADEIIYANTQARHFLGLLSEESLQEAQKLMPLLHKTYQVHSSAAWNGWPKRPSSAVSRYLIYTLPHSFHQAVLKVDIVEQIQLGGKNIWVVTMQLINSPRTAAKHLIV